MDGINEEFSNLSLNKMFEYYLEQQDLFGYNIVPFAIDLDDFLCIYFDEPEVSIIYWSSERAIESRDMAMFKVCDNIGSF